MASAQAVFDAKDIELIDGMGLSLADVLKLILMYWNPDKAAYRQIKANLSAAVASKNPQELCRILTGGDFAEAIVQAIAQVITQKLSVITTALPGCKIDCSGGKPSAVSVIKSVVEISVKSFSGDGVNFGALIAGAITEIVCCALQLGVSYAVKRIGPARILGKLRERCVKLISAGSQTARQAIAAAESAGYGGPPATQAQIDAAVQTTGASLQTTARQQALALDDQIKALETEYMQKTAGPRARIYEIEKIYGPEFEREISGARKRGDHTRVAQLEATWKSLESMKAGYQRQIQEIARPYLEQIKQLGGQSEQILASAGLTGTVNWKPLQVAAATAVVGSGLVVFSPVVMAAGAIALLVGLFRRT